MAKLSPKIKFYDEDKLSKINPETLSLWRKYEIDMGIRELSIKTINGYKNDLHHFWVYIYDNFNNKSITEINDDDITEFIYYCKSHGNNSRRIKRRMSSISAFFLFLRKKKIISENPMEFLSRPTKDVDVITQTFLTIEQIDLMREKLQDLVDGAKSKNGKHYALQIQCYALLSLITMARVNAVSSIRFNQIDYDNRIISDVLEKEGYVVELSFNDEVKNLLLGLKKFREENYIDDNGFVFISSNEGEKNITSGTLHSWCKVVGGLIGVPTLHPHDFRHSYSSLLKNMGMPLEEVSLLLNHKDTSTTQKFYVKSDTTKLRESKDKFII